MLCDPRALVVLAALAACGPPLQVRSEPITQLDLLHATVRLPPGWQRDVYYGRAVDPETPGPRDRYQFNYAALGRRVSANVREIPSYLVEGETERLHKATPEVCAAKAAEYVTQEQSIDPDPDVTSQVVEHGVFRGCQVDIVVTPTKPLHDMDGSLLKNYGTRYWFLSNNAFEIYIVCHVTPFAVADGALCAAIPQGITAKGTPP
jgi:hypothetical protein